MPKELTLEQVYDKLASDGLYQEAHLDKDEVRKVLTIPSYLPAAK
jgi:hypothetical protein